MAAILTSQPHQRSTQRSAGPGSGSPRLVVLDGGRSRRAPPAPAGTSRVRRLVAAGALVVLAAVAVLGVRAGLATVITPTTAERPAATGPAADGSAGPTMTVEPGDTLWRIARELQPTGEVRPLVDELVAANGSRPLQPGQEIRLPARF